MRSTVIIMSLLLTSCGMDIRGAQGPQGVSGTPGDSHIIAFAYTSANGSIQNSLNLSVRPLIPGQYNYTFHGITPPKNYLVLCTATTPCMLGLTNEDVLTCDLHFEDSNTNTFGVYIYEPGGNWVACDHSVLVVSN